MAASIQQVPVTEPTEAMTITESNLMTSQPFFAHILFNVLVVVPTEDPRIPTAATDGRTVWINIHFFDSLSQPERVFLYCHEIYHAILLHMSRGKHYKDVGGPDGVPFEHKRWNFAADYVINDALIKDGIGAMIKGGLHDSQYTCEMVVDDVYIKLKDNMPPPPPGGSPCDGGEPGEGGHGGFDDHILSDEAGMTEAETAEVEIAVKQALADAKARGKLPGTLRDMIDGLLNPKVDWGSVLLQEIAKSVGHGDANWARPNRRKLCGVYAPKMILPTAASTTSGTMVITIDTSGSITQHEAKAFLSEIYSITTDFTPEEVHILWVDSKVAHVDYFDEMSEMEDIIERCMTEPLPGGGGTDMTKTFHYIEEWGIEPTTCLIFTDGYTPFGEAQDYPVVWGITHESQMDSCPHGAKILVEIDDE